MTPEQARELDNNPIWQAFKRGETIEFFAYTDRVWKDIQDISAIHLLEYLQDYRIKQERFPEPPDGEQWHNPEGLTPSQVGVKDGWRLCLFGETLPEGYEWWSSGNKEWIPYADSIRAAGKKIGEFESYTTVRTREPLPQKPRMVPLGPEDVPPGSAVRRKLWDANGTYSLVISVNRDSIVADVAETKDFIQLANIPFVLLKDKWLIKRPGEDWQKCEKPEKTK